jgi:UDP-3-O-[3-hydroxymyristoyl] glucosamine N-acyltransferase
MQKAIPRPRNGLFACIQFAAEPAGSRRNKMTLGELVAVLGGTLKQGNAERVIEYVSSYEQADPDSLIFIDNPATAADAFVSTAGSVVLRAEFGLQYPESMCVVEAEHPRLWFAKAAKLLGAGLPVNMVDPTAVVARTAVLERTVKIGATAVLGEDVWIGAGAVLGTAVSIGKDCRIHPRAVLYGGTTLGDRVVVHAGAVLGADGFGYVRDPATGAYTQFPQQGTLEIEDDVEIGANTTIDRGALKRTRIGRGTKIDNLVHIGHNCDIGEDVILVALTGISGSSSVGDGAVIAGQVGIGDHAHVGPGVILGGQAGVLSGKTVTNEGLRPGTVLWGTPARPLKQVLREQAVLARLAKSGRKGPGRASPEKD